MSIHLSYPKSLWAFLLNAILVVSPLWAQKNGEAIVGLVRDASGAVVADAKITVEDVDLGMQLTVFTNEQGEYVAIPLSFGQFGAISAEPMPHGT